MIKNFNTCAFFFCIFIIHNTLELGMSDCLNKEDVLSILETAEDFLSKANDVSPTCNQSECGETLSKPYIAISRKFISDVRENFQTSANVVVQDDKPRDCSEILANGRSESGVYTIWPSESCASGKPLQVYCDMDTDYGGWTIIQRRGKYEIQQDFNQDWENYKNGFGNITEEFWLGNENIRVLCYKGCEIRFDLEAKDGSKGFAVYRNFNLTRNSYRFYVSHYRGNVGDGMKEHNNYAFLTKDKGNVINAEFFQGGWWHHAGTIGYNLNGVYEPGIFYTGIFWISWRSNGHLAGSEIKVRSK